MAVGQVFQAVGLLMYLFQICIICVGRIKVPSTETISVHLSGGKSMHLHVLYPGSS